jgi:hypothetical protein
VPFRSIGGETERSFMYIGLIIVAASVLIRVGWRLYRKRQVP